jgi:hypothetical protein
MASAVWKMIESAPRDRTKVLLYARCKTIPDDKPAPIVGLWNKDVMRWKVASEYLCQADELHPSHWIEIPELPRVTRLFKAQRLTGSDIGKTISPIAYPRL